MGRGEEWSALPKVQRYLQALASGIVAFRETKRREELSVVNKHRAVKAYK